MSRRLNTTKRMDKRKKPKVHWKHPQFSHLTVCGAGVKGSIVTVKKKNVTDVMCLGFKRIARKFHG